MFAPKRIPIPRLALQRQWPQLLRTYSEVAAKPAPLVLKLRDDMKTAMKAKDRERLNVIKSILAEITNASTAQPPKPTKTDSDLLPLLSKMQKKLSTSIAEFQAAKRDDLVANEQKQLDIVSEYEAGIEKLTGSELVKVLKDVKESLGGKPANIGVYMGAFTKAMEELGKKAEEEGKSVLAWSSREVMEIIKEEMKTLGEGGKK